MGCKHSNKAAREAADGIWQLVAAGEPFRLLFPLGVCIGLVGVSLWPLHAWNIMTTYPGPVHARVMIEGFLTSFVIGFLGTALPRLLDVPRIGLGETLGFAATMLAITWAHVAGQTSFGDQIFFFTLLCFIGALGFRALVFRRDVPPPGFVLVLLGLLSALFGAATQSVAHIAPSSLPEWLVRLGRLLLMQGYLAFPIMGIGAFLLPRFFGLPNRQTFPESLALPPGWKRRALFALGCGMLLMTGFLLEALGMAHIGNGLRAAGILIYFAREVPVHKAGFGGGSLALGLRLALVAIPGAYLLMAFWPERSYSFLHVLFITGFSLLTFIVASRVVLGHSGQSERFRDTIWPVLILVALLVLAMLTRVSADWMPALRISHYAYAAIVWGIGVVIWAIKILPGVRQADSEE